jgi:PAS domain S-box-containing protein
MVARESRFASRQRGLYYGAEKMAQPEPAPPADPTSADMHPLEASLDYHALLHAMPGPWVVLLPDAPRFTIAAASESYYRAAMKGPDDLLGEGLFEALPDANPDNPERTGHANIRGSLEKVLRTKQPDQLKEQRYDAERPDGTWEEYYWQPLNTPLLGTDGSVTCILQTMHNVTARVLAERAADVAEQQLRMAFLQAPALVALTSGAEHRFVLANPGYEEIVGRGGLVGQTVADALPGLEALGSIERLDRVFATGEAFVAIEQHIVHEREGGEPREGWYNIVHQPLLDASGRTTGILQHVVDVTAQVRARMEVEEARAEAERANRAKSDFLAIMSHELRTPLNAISGYADLLELGIHGPVTDAQREALSRIRFSQQHLLGLINDVLNYAKLETGSVRYEVDDVSVRELFTAVESLVAPQVRSAGLTLVRADVPEHVRVRADEEKVRQILLNLLSNAVKFTGRRGSGRIDLSYEEAQSVVHVRVRDTGIGIPEDKLETIFEPFVQVRGDLTRTAEGTGLGLAISRDLARGLGGDLRAASTPGEGSTFTLTLPRA